MSRRILKWLILIGLVITSASTFAMERALAELTTRAIRNWAPNCREAQQFTPENTGAYFKERDAQDPRRIQLWSLNQMEKNTIEPQNDFINSLSTSSCGYRALYNGIHIAKAQLFSNQRDQHLGLLRNERMALDTFGTLQSRWRSKIIDDRIKVIVKAALKEQMLRLLNGEKIETEFESVQRGLYFTTFAKNKVVRKMTFTALPAGGTVRELELYIGQLDTVVAELANRNFIPVENGRRYELARDVIFETFRRKLNENGGERAQLANEEKFNIYFNNQPIEVTVNFDHEIYANDNRLLYKHSSLLPYGAWLENNDITTLKHFEREENDGNLRQVRNLLVASYGEMAGDMDVLDENNIVNDEMAQLYRVMRDSPRDIVAIVLIYLPQSLPLSYLAKGWNWFSSFFSGRSSIAKEQKKAESESTNGHWISLIVSRLNNVTQYVVVDSMNNSCLREQKINEVIDILDGRRALPGYRNATVGELQPILRPNNAVLAEPVAPANLGALPHAPVLPGQAPALPQLTEVQVHQMLNAHLGPIIPPKQQAQGQLRLTTTGKVVCSLVVAAAAVGGYSLYKKKYGARPQPQSAPNPEGDQNQQKQPQPNFLI